MAESMHERPCQHGVPERLPELQQSVALSLREDDGALASIEGNLASIHEVHALLHGNHRAGHSAYARIDPLIGEYGAKISDII